MNIYINITKITKSKYIFIVLFFSIVVISLAGCGIEPPKSMVPPAYVKPTAKNGGVKSKPVIGSLWSGSQNSSNLYTDNTAYRLNDIVTIIVDDQTQAADTSGTTLSKNSTGQGSFSFGSSTSKPTGYSGSNVESFNGGGGVAESGQINTTIEANVVKVYPDGNLEIKGEREVSMNGQTRYILIEGTIRPIDISPGNTVLSTQIANERIWMNGKNVGYGQTTPGWLYKIMNFLWPF